jgi:hypothetical protein
VRVIIQSERIISTSSSSIVTIVIIIDAISFQVPLLVERLRLFAILSIRIDLMLIIGINVAAIYWNSPNNWQCQYSYNVVIRTGK